MTLTIILQNIGKTDTATVFFYKGSKSKAEIKLLQTCLNNLGFGAALNWEKFGADGFYGNSTIAAVAAFCQQNDIDSNGETVTNAILEKIKIATADSANEEIKQLFQKILSQEKPQNYFVRGSKNKAELKVLQTALYAIGYEKELNWAKYGADGGYGQSTVDAVLAFANKNDFENNGESVSLEMLEKINQLSQVVPYLQILNKVREAQETIQKGSDKTKVKALQNILHHLGYDTALNWSKFGADGFFGNSCIAAVSAFANTENLSFDNEKANTEIINKMIASYESGLGESWKESKTTTITDATINDTSTHVEVIENGLKAKFQKFRKGLYTEGSQSIPNFLKDHEGFLEVHEISDSSINVIRSVAENEGKLDAINTWDNAFLSFGMFQWTIGVGNGKGELPALLKKIKTENPELFQKYFGIYGLDVSSDTSNTYGNLVLNNQKIISQKQQFRSAQWAGIFWRAGQDAGIQAFEIDHAISRLQNFYWRKKSDLNNFALSNYITSEFGVALLLDNHVNRPAFVVPCIKKALTMTGLSNPENWTTTEETKLIQAYLEVRKTYRFPKVSPMTDAHKRAAVTLKYVTNGTISKERLSFQFNEVAARSTNNAVNQPLDFSQNEFEEIIENKDFEI